MEFFLISVWYRNYLNQINLHEKAIFHNFSYNFLFCFENKEKDVLNSSIISLFADNPLQDLQTQIVFTQS